MSAVLYVDAPIACLLLAILCYCGVVLYATSAAIRGLRRAAAEALVSFAYAAVFPLPASLPLVYVIQFCVFATVLPALGALQLGRSIARRRALYAYREGVTPGPLPRATVLLICLPALALSVSIVGGILATGDSTAPLEGSLETGTWRLVSCIALLAAYMLLSSYVDRDWVRSVGRIRLLNVDARFQWINAVVAAAAVLALVVILAGGIGSRAAGYATLVGMAVGLLPVLNGLSWIYDAVFRRVLSFHLLLAALAAVAFGLQAIGGSLELSPLARWALLLAALGLTAVTLGPRIDAALERWLFPRAAEMRARLMAIAESLPTARTRAEAAAGMLEKLVSVLDAEGGAIVIEGDVVEPTAIVRTGSVDANRLGASPAEVTRYTRGLDVRGPRLIEDLHLPDQLRLLEAGIYLICPLPARRTEATLLLGPRRGWLYDDAAIRALRVLAHQLGLALENLALANARAHGERLAALGGAAARIAHEIRNPLAGARSLLQLLGRSDADGLAATAVEELDRIGRLVGDLLAFSRRDDVDLTESVDLAAVCADAVRETQALEGGAIDVRTDLAPALVVGDRRRLVQVIANLCRNAIESLGDGARGGTVVVRSAAVDGHAVVEISDDGPGISAEVRARLFEPFHTTKSSGTGLGLPIARGIVESHGGRIAVESEPGVATVFRVELPLIEAGAALRKAG